jgi:FkbM family methyltransferase
MKLTVGLPNGTTCYLASDSMRLAARYLRWEIFKKQRYLHPGFELRPTDTVVDIGGNIGMFMLWAAPQVPQGRLVTVEPNPAAYACLKLNVERNGLSNVTAVHAAASRDGGTTELFYHPGWEGIAYCGEVNPPWFYTDTRSARLARWVFKWLMRQPQPAQAALRVLTVPQMSLGRIMDEHKLDVVNYLKLDCEGSEFEIFRNVGRAHWARIERVAIEYHDYGSHRNHRELVAILEDNGFEVEIHRSLMERTLRHLLRAKFGAIWARNLTPLSAGAGQATRAPVGAASS